MRYFHIRFQYQMNQMVINIEQNEEIMAKQFQINSTRFEAKLEGLMQR